MKITIKDSKKICREFVYNKQNHIFELMDQKRNVLAEINTKILLDDEYNPNNFVVKILHNNRNDCTEESIYQVLIERQRIGWIFPIQSIHSKEHSYSENAYYLKYAYVAWCHLLSSCVADVEFIEDFNLFNFYQDDINLLVLDNDNCAKITDFDYDKYIVSLFQNGYSESGLGNLFSDSIVHDKTIKLCRMSNNLDDIPYIIELFRNQIPNETNEISRFHTYYQIIEILISKVFDDLFMKFLDELGGDSNNLFERKEKLSEFTNEKYRVKRLCNDYSKIETSLRNELNEKCKSLLVYTNGKTGNEMHDNLYQVRCLIVHRMYLLDDKAKIILKEINDLFLDLIIQLTMTFHVERGTILI